MLAFEPQPGKMTELFQSGQAVLAVWGSGRVKAFQDTGFPAEFVYPKEGAMALGISACPTAKPNAVAAGAAVHRTSCCSPRCRWCWPRARAPARSTARRKLPPELQKGLPYGDAVGKLLTIDWDTVNANRTAWNNRWTREIER